MRCQQRRRQEGIWRTPVPRHGAGEISQAFWAELRLADLLKQKESLIPVAYFGRGRIPGRVEPPIGQHPEQSEWNRAEQ